MSVAERRGREYFVQKQLWPENFFGHETAETVKAITELLVLINHIHRFIPVVLKCGPFTGLCCSKGLASLSIELLHHEKFILC